MSDSVTTLSNFLLTASLLASNNQTLTKLTQQMSSGNAASSLVDYGSNAQTVLNLKSSQQTLQSYQQAGTVVGTYMSAYSDSLSQLQTDADTLQGALTAFNVNDPVSLANLQTAVNGVMTDISATLNGQVDSRYIFGGAGTRLTTEPTVDDMLSVFQSQSASLPATAPSITDPTNGFVAAQPGDPTVQPFTGTLPDYDNNYNSSGANLGEPNVPQTPASASATQAQISTVNDSYATQTATVGDNRQVDFGISANDPTFQSLIYSVQSAYFAITSAKQAQTNPAPSNATQLLANAQTYVGNAESAANTAIYGGTSANGVAVSGLQNLATQVGGVQGTLSNISDVNTQTLANLTTQTSSLESVDASTIAEEISALENQLNASYKVTSSVMEMSLLNYL